MPANERMFQTECAACGKEMELDLSDDPGADAHSVEGYEVYCSFSCEQEAY